MKKLLILTILFVVSCSSNEGLEQVSFNQFKEDALNVKKVQIQGDLVEVETFDGRKYEVVVPISGYSEVEDVLSGLDVEIYFLPPPAPSIWSQLLVGLFPLLLIFLSLAVWAAYLASNRNQSRALWFFLTLIFPIAILFIATKDRIKKN